MNAKPPFSSTASSSPTRTLKRPGEDVDRLLLRVMDVERRAAVRRDLDDEVVERAAGVVAGDLEDEIAAGAGLQAQAVVGSEELGTERWSASAASFEYICAAQVFFRENLTVSSNIPPEPDPFTPEEFAAWRGLLRLRETVTRAIDERLRAEHGLSLDDYGILITLVGQPTGASG